MKNLNDHIGKIVSTLSLAFILGGVGVYYKIGKMETMLLSMKESQTKVLETEVANLKESKKAQWAVIGDLREKVEELRVKVGQ